MEPNSHVMADDPVSTTSTDASDGDQTSPTVSGLKETPAELETDRHSPSLPSIPSSPPPSDVYPPSSPPSPPPSTMPSFLSALNLKPKETSPQETGHVIRCEDPGEVDDEGMDVSSPRVTLTEKFKEDPSSVLQLLRSALSVDKLADLIKSEYHSDTTELETLQNRLEEAYSTLQGCSDKKQSLHGQIEDTNENIRSKRKHLESLREELKVLGEEEVQLKKRRDVSYSKCSELKRKIQSSRDALQQITTLCAKSEGRSGTITS